MIRFAIPHSGFRLKQTTAVEENPGGGGTIITSLLDGDLIEGQFKAGEDRLPAGWEQCRIGSCRRLFRSGGQDPCWRNGKRGPAAGSCAGFFTSTRREDTPLIDKEIL